MGKLTFLPTTLDLTYSLEYGDKTLYIFNIKIQPTTSDEGGETKCGYNYESDGQLHVVK